MGEKFFLEGKEKQKNRDFEGALELYLKALEVDSENADWLSETGVALFNLERIKEALVYLNNAADVEPDNSYRYSSRAYVKGALKDYEGAVLDYQKCIELDPDDSIAYNNLGLAQEQLGYYQKAQENFEVADEMEGILRENNISSSESSKGFQITEKEAVEEKESTLSVLKNVFTQKESFNEFLSFIKNGFKLKK